jgi:hypothetical protein
MERMIQDYNVLLYTLVAGTWYAAAACLCGERLGERERTHPYYSHFRKHMNKNSLKWLK